ncbi:MAG: phosphoribosylformylglycinamidine synthase subunit PurL [candidate division WOR-3 bacterium]
MILEIVPKNDSYDSLGLIIKNEMKKRHLRIEKVRTSNLYFFDRDIDLNFLQDLLVDSITDEIYIHPDHPFENSFFIDIYYKDGVMDPAGETLKNYLLKSSFEVENVKTIRRFYFFSEEKVDKESIIRFLKNRYFNPLVEQVGEFREKNKIQKKIQEFEIKYIDLDCDLEKLSKDMFLSLNLKEMEVIKDYFYKKLKRKPTDVELETIAQTWSEHCVHKTFKSPFKYKNKKIKNLFKETIMKASYKINHPDTVSLFSDNAGIVKFDEYHNICFKVETHNHPSALEPYGGAGTGIGGVIRDIIGTGLSAKPIANTDVFCIGIDEGELKENETIIPPDEILKGVVAGVRDYGNRMGIPTINGAVCYHKNFLGNPLVFAGSIGVMKSRNSFKKVVENDYIVLIGGKTGRDGIHGATFSSTSLTEDSQELSSGAVQIGNPIEEKKMLDAIMEMDGLFNAITDCGAGGLSSAVGEMGEETGAVVFLEKVPLKYEGLSYSEIWISESQERMVLSVPPKNFERIKEIAEKYNTEVSHIGYFKGKKLELYFYDKLVLSLDMDFLHKGVPLFEKKALPYVNFKESKRKEKYKFSIDDAVKKVISSNDVKSKEWIVRKYDHEVQSQTLIKPLGGKTHNSPNDSSVLFPLFSKEKCIVVGCGINPRYGELNVKKMTYAVIDESIRNVLSQGGDLDHTFLLDNFCFGDVTNPHTLGAIVESTFACYDYTVRLKTPFISGKDSLNNYFIMKDKKIEIPPTLLISALSVSDVDNIKSSYFKMTQKPSSIVILGKETKEELAGSILYTEFKIRNGFVPDIDIFESTEIHRNFNEISKKRMLISAHDISDGGLFVTLFESCIGNDLGCEIEIKSKLDPIDFLFSETQTRYVVQVYDDDIEYIEKIIGKKYLTILGRVVKKPLIKIKYNNKIYKFETRKLMKLYR